MSTEATAEELLLELAGLGSPVPAKVVPLKLKEKTPAYYDDALDELVVNVRSPYWKKAEGNAKAQFDAGWWSTDDPRHPLIHEIGHAAHAKHDRRLYLALKHSAMPDEVLIALTGKVSGYAMTSPHEFVAEVFAGLLAGEEYGDDVMAWYVRWRGFPIHLYLRE